MQEISIGKMRGLQRCTNERGVFACLALDHRQNLRRALNPDDPSQVSDQALSEFKLLTGSALGAQATALLYDPEFSAAQAVARGAMPRGAGLVVALESTGYTGDPNARQAQILPGWGPAKVKRMGADAAKLLVYYHPDSSTAAEIEAFVRRTAEECARLDLALMLEPLSYPLDPGQKSLASEEKRYVVVETARRLTVPGVDILKAEFPLDIATEPDEAAWERACSQVSQASNAPWILLSAAEGFEVYLRQVEVACRAGASGIAVGRAVWKEAVGLPPASRPGFLKTVAYERFQRLSALAAALARPWTDFYSSAAIDAGWYRDYAA